MNSTSSICSPQTDAQEQQREPVETQRMDPELKAKWVAALRSGDYRQCRRVLHNGHGYCCLGVLSRLMGHPERELRGVASNGPDDVRFAVDRDTQTVCGELADMNDGGVTFPEIAAYIEAHL